MGWCCLFRIRCDGRRGLREVVVGFAGGIDLLDGECEWRGEGGIELIGGVNDGDQVGTLNSGREVSVCLGEIVHGYAVLKMFDEGDFGQFDLMGKGLGGEMRGVGVLHAILKRVTDGDPVRGVSLVDEMKLGIEGGVGLDLCMGHEGRDA